MEIDALGSRRYLILLLSQEFFLLYVVSSSTVSLSLCETMFVFLQRENVAPSAQLSLMSHPFCRCGHPNPASPPCRKVRSQANTYMQRNILAQSIQGPAPRQLSPRIAQDYPPLFRTFAIRKS